jgi:hypothetical protein
MTTAARRMMRERPADDDLDLLFHPGRRYKRPADVLADPALSLDERRAILSSWASDACAVESAPALRRPPFAPEPVSFDEVMDALLRLDQATLRRSRKAGRSRLRPGSAKGAEAWPAARS